LLPHSLPVEKVHELLNLVNADTLVCEPGTLPIDGVARECRNLRVITSVVPKSSLHMDWAGVPDSAQSRLKIGVWNDILEDNEATASAALPGNDAVEKSSDLVTVWQSTDSAVKPMITTFTQSNIVSAVAALITALPLRQRITPSDLLLPVDSFSHTYTLAWTLAALFTHASVAINSVAGPSATLAAASRSISPTIIIATAATLSELHTETAATITSPLHKLGLFTQSQSLSAGRMPGSSLLLPSKSSTTSPGKLRLILTSDRLDADSPPLSSSTLSDLRIFTRARIVYALTASGVFGAVAQTHVFDYRREEGEGHSRFGAPVSSVEIRVVGSSDQDVGKSEPVGELVVAGPAVAGGEWRSGKRVRIGEDGCIGYV
jgi:acyl-CoA synthetase (AMP-forming)/AMP-acid ligase II